MENTNKIVAEFKRRMNIEVRKQKNIDMAEKRDFRRRKLLGKYIAKMLCVREPSFRTQYCYQST